LLSVMSSPSGVASIAAYARAIAAPPDGSGAPGLPPMVQPPRYGGGEALRSASRRRAPRGGRSSGAIRCNPFVRSASATASVRDPSGSGTALGGALPSLERVPAEDRQCDGGGGSTRSGEPRPACRPSSPLRRRRSTPPLRPPAPRRSHGRPPLEVAFQNPTRALPKLTTPLCKPLPLFGTREVQIGGPQHLLLALVRH
jgi:hypothetical protein